MSTWTRKGAAMVVALTIASSCSSTTKDPSGAKGSSATRELATHGEPATEPSAAASEQQGPAPSAGQPGASAPARIRPATERRSGAEPRSGTATRGPALAAVNEPLKIGVTVRSGNPGRALGVSYAYDDWAKVVRAMIDDINATGGMAGRRVEAVVLESDQTNFDASNQTRQENEMCTALTEDHKVFMVVSLSQTHYVVDCYVRHETPVAGVGAASRDDPDYAKLLPWVLPTVGPSLRRTARMMIDTMKSQGFMTPKMGVVAWDLPGMRKSAETTLIPLIEANGGKVVDKVFMSVTAHELASQSAAAVLRFNQQKIDRVVMWAPGGGFLFFARQAEAQEYRPRYALSSLDGAQAMRDFVPREQYIGAVGAGWAPGADVAPSTYPLTAAEKDCFARINKRAGTNYTNRQNGLPAVFTCEVFGSTRAAFQQVANKPIARADVLDLFSALGESYKPLVTPKSRYAKGKLDGSAVYARFRLDPSCDCLRYFTPWLDAPQ